MNYDAPVESTFVLSAVLFVVTLFWCHPVKINAKSTLSIITRDAIAKIRHEKSSSRKNCTDYIFLNF